MTSGHFVSYPAHSLQGEITIPGDKSISHRAVMLGSIAKGMTVLEGFLEGEDCRATLEAFQSMGVEIERTSAGSLVIQGVGLYGLKKPHGVIHCGNSGTTLRLLAGILAAQPFDSVLTGDSSLLKRPMERICRPLTEMGADLETTSGCAPILIRGGRRLKGITYAMPEASAQVKSCILLAGLYAKGETQVIEFQKTRDHTERLLKAFCWNTLSQSSITTLQIPGDLSSAAFFIVAATLIPNSKLFIRNVGMNPTRTGVLDLLNAMGASIQIHNPRCYGTEPVADLEIQHAPLKGIEIAPHQVPLAIDEFPILFIAAACAQGETLLRGAKELRYKESDRISVMVQGLQQLGIGVEAFEDGVRIQGGILEGGTVESYKDHRIAMAFAVAGAVAQGPVIVRECTHVATSFPTFLETARQIQWPIKEITHDESTHTDHYH